MLDTENRTEEDTSARDGVIGVSDTWLTVALYVAAGVVYVLLGVFFPRFVLSLVEGMAFLLIAVVGIPMLVHRIRHR